MTKPVFIFIGRSGCGKGTQAEYLNSYIKNIDSQALVLYLQTGAEFREFIKQKGLIPDLARGVLARGERQPDFLVIYLWSRFLLNLYDEKSYMIYDGTPRSEHEARIMNTVFPFLGRKEVYILFVEVSKEEAAKRLLARGRSDDNPEEIEKRLGWFDTDVLPAVEYLASNPWYAFIHINGEQNKEDVFKEIVTSLKSHGFGEEKENE